MKLPSLFSKTPESPPPTSSWPWPSCGNPKTLSFRASTAVGGHIFKTINSVYLDSTTIASTTDTPELGGGGEGESSVEEVIRGLRSAERLFFDPGETSSIMEAATSSRKIEDTKKDEDEDEDGDGNGFVAAPILEDDDNERRRRRSVVVEVESRDPHVDFKRSMEEMVEAHGLKDWEGFEELLSCYLRVNGKRNHGYIIGAFVDLLLGLGFATSSSSPFSSSSSSSSSSSAISAQSPTSALSFSSSGVTSTSTSPCLSSLEEAEDEIEKTLDNASSS